MLSLLVREADWITAGELADVVGVTPRSIRSYVTALNARVPGGGVVVDQFVVRDRVLGGDGRGAGIARRVPFEGGRRAVTGEDLGGEGRELAVPIGQDELLGVVVILAGAAEALLGLGQCCSFLLMGGLPVRGRPGRSAGGPLRPEAPHPPGAVRGPV